MSIPNDKALWEKVKAEVFKQYKTNSAYRSGAVVKRYKELGGTFQGKKKNEGLTRWFKEEWQDIGGASYPVYRPTKRITKETPLTASEISPTQLKKQVKRKQVIKSDTLPPFIEKKNVRKKKI